MGVACRFWLLLLSVLTFSACDPIYRKHYPIRQERTAEGVRAYLSLYGKDYAKVHDLAVRLATRNGMVREDLRYCSDRTKPGCEFEVYGTQGRTDGFRLRLTEMNRPEKDLELILEDFPSFDQGEKSKAFEKELLDSLSRD